MRTVHTDCGNWLRLAFAVLLIPLLSCAACLPPASDSLFDVGEMVGGLAGSSAEVFLQLGSLVTPEHEFKMGYDSSSHASEPDYPFETQTQTGKVEGDRLTFSIPDGLSVNTRYYYAVACRSSPESEWTWRPERSFSTTRTAGLPFRFCVVSDFHYAGILGENDLRVRIAQNIQADQPDFVLALGDTILLSNQGCGDPVDCSLAYFSEKENPTPYGCGHVDWLSVQQHKYYYVFLLRFE